MLLFDAAPLSGRPHLDVLPVSVIDIESDAGQRREAGEHDEQSSRNQYSNFPREVGDLSYALYLRKSSLVFDPFAGWGERGALAKIHDKKYCGYDISAEAIGQASHRYQVNNTLADSRCADIPVFDGLLTCPPYWNLETYSDIGIENAPSFAVFCREMRLVWRRCFDAAKKGALFCVQVGDWRSDGEYFDLTYQTMRAFDDMGAEPVDSVVISRKRITKIKIMVPQAVRLGYTVKVHETLLVYRKR
jgi:hypothetical protein